MQVRESDNKKQGRQAAEQVLEEDRRVASVNRPRVQASELQSGMGV
jgi:hypothetical protein